MTENSNMKSQCLFHEGRELKGYCRVCKSAVCFLCISSKCVGHQIDDNLQEIIMQQMDDIISQTQKFRDEDIVKLDVKLQTLEQLELQCDMTATERKVHILYRAQCLKEEKDRIIDEAIKLLLQEVEEMRQNQKSEITKVRSEICKVKEKSETKLQNWDKTVRVKSDPSVLQIGTMIESCRKEIANVSDSYMPPCSQRLDNNISAVFNKLKGSLDALNREPELANESESLTSTWTAYTSDAVTTTDNAKVLKEFKFGDSHVHSMCSTCENNVWILGSEKIVLMENDRKCLREFSLTCKVSSMAINQDGDLLVSLPEQRVISKYSRSRNSGSILFLETGNLIPCGIAVCHNTGEILVGLVDKLDYAPTKDSERIVVRFNTDGREKRKYLGYLDKKSTFVQPLRIAVGQNDIFAVINRFGQLKGEILIFKHGEIYLTYPQEKSTTGLVKRSPRIKFDPRDLDFDVLNNIITCDYESKNVIVINCGTGELIKEIYDCGTWPYCLTCFPNQKLWLGCAGGSIKVLKYLTYDS